MTNTNDFRRYSYRNDTAYMIDSFSMNRGTQAPKLRPGEETGTSFKVRENARVKSKSQMKAEQNNAFNMIIKIAAAALVCLAMVAVLLNSMAVKNELTRQISKQQIAIENAKSENISLQSELDAMVSISMIDEYAVEKLGMRKVKSNQIQYMDVGEYKAQRQKNINSRSPAKYADELGNIG